MGIKNVLLVASQFHLIVYYYGHGFGQGGNVRNVRSPLVSITSEDGWEHYLLP